MYTLIVPFTTTVFYPYCTNHNNPSFGSYLGFSFVIELSENLFFEKFFIDYQSVTKKFEKFF